MDQANYIGSFPSYDKCPKDNRPEYAFIGRSNVGKSSLINMLCGRKALARISGKPGKTQMLNYFLIEDSWYIVDLPGYGYAKISKKKRSEWRKMIEDYLVRRPNLQCAFILIDSNISPQKIDIEFINWMGEKQIPFVIVYTKTDKIKPAELEENVRNFQEALLVYWNALPQQFYTSARKAAGKTEIIDFIREVNARVS